MSLERIAIIVNMLMLVIGGVYYTVNISAQLEVVATKLEAIDRRQAAHAGINGHEWMVSTAARITSTLEKIDERSARNQAEIDRLRDQVENL